MGLGQQERRAAGRPDSNCTYNKTTDIAGPLTIAAAYDGGTDDRSRRPRRTMFATRIVAVGASKFLENDSRRAGRRQFLHQLPRLAREKGRRARHRPEEAAAYGVSLYPMSYRTVVWTAAFFIPGAALALGIFTWFSRRK